MNLIDILQQDGFSPKKASSANGGEYSSRCPWCGGKDRFRSWPEKGSGGRFWCRGCEKSGDAIDYLRTIRHMTYSEACVLTGHKLEKPIEKRANPIMPSFTRIKREKWQRKAESILQTARQNIKQAYPFLQERGIRPETAKKNLLGWLEKDHYFDRRDWGLNPEKRDDGKERRVWLPSGLLIPFLKDDKVLRLRIRRPKGDPRYVVVSGSLNDAIVWPADCRIAIVVESELDGILVAQEAGEMANIIALGSAQMKPSAGLMSILKRMDAIFVALDADRAGGKAAWQWWYENFPEQFVRWPVPEGKDPGDYYKLGGDIRRWVTIGLEKESERLERVAIQKETEQID